MMGLALVQEKLHEWRVRNFPHADADQQLMGMMEELGELAHAHLKQKQGIRGDDNLHEAEAKDAIGDLLIYTLGYCSYRGWDAGQILYDTGIHVMKRDWIEDPFEGKSPVAEP